MLQALTYDPDNPDLLYASLQLAAATGRHEEAVQLAGRVLKINPQHSLAVMVMAVEAARQGDLKGAEAQLAVLPGQGFDPVLLPLLNAWIKAGQGDVDGGLQTLAVLQGDGGTGVLHDFNAALIHDLAGPPDAPSQRVEGLPPDSSTPHLRPTRPASHSLT